MAVRTKPQASSTHATLYTVGHSALSTSRLLELLAGNSIAVVVDVRSQPYSRFHPQHNRESLRDALKAAGIRYAFMGDTLGGRPQETCHYDSDGRVDYGSWAASPLFQHGLSRLVRSVEKYRVAILCSEEDPTECHRHLLIARVLLETGWSPAEILDIRATGAVVAEASLAEQLRLDGERTWKSPQSVLRKLLRSDSSSA